MGLCAGIVGKWCVKAIFPTYTPKKIRYRYPGEQWQEVVGESYSLTINPGEPGQITGKWYAVDLDCNLYFEGGVSNFQKYGFYLTLGVQGPVGGLTFQLREGTSPYNAVWPVVQGLNPARNNAWYAADRSADPFRGSQILSGLWGTNWRIVRIRPQNPNDPDPPTSTCTFKVFSATGAVLLEITRPGCPEVTEIPEKCEFKPENERQVGEWYNLFGRNMFNPIIFPYATIEPDLLLPNCVRVFVINPINPLFKLELTYICSECPDRPPIVWIECPCDDCRDKKCPEGTAYKLLEGNTLLCLNSEGCVIASVPYDPRCEQPNCSCG